MAKPQVEGTRLVEAVRLETVLEARVVALEVHESQKEPSSFPSRV